MSGADRAGPAMEVRLAMVEALRGAGLGNPAVLEAMTRVPRHRFVPRFWLRRRQAGGVREFSIRDDEVAEALGLA